MSSIRQILRFYYFWMATAPNLFRLREMGFLRRHLVVSKEDLVLDVACGIGVYAEILSRKSSKVVGFDLSADNVSIANIIGGSRTMFYQGNAEEICHPDNAFDVVVSLCAIEHFNDARKSILEMYRVLKPGGRLLITADSMSNVNSEKFIEFHRKYCLVNKYFTLAELRELLEDSGFEIKAEEPILASTFSAILCVFAFKLMRWPALFRSYSVITYPLSLLSDKLSGIGGECVTAGMYAIKPEEHG